MGVVGDPHQHAAVEHLVRRRKNFLQIGDGLVGICLVDEQTRQGRIRLRRAWLTAFRLEGENSVRHDARLPLSPARKAEITPAYKTFN